MTTRNSKPKPGKGREGDERIQAQSLCVRAELSAVMRGDVMPVKFRVDANCISFVKQFIINTSLMKGAHELQ